MTDDATATGPFALRDVRCCVCGEPILSELSVAGEAEDTGEPICQACWFIRKARRAADRDVIDAELDEAGGGSEDADEPAASPEPVVVSLPVPTPVPPLPPVTPATPSVPAPPASTAVAVDVQAEVAKLRGRGEPAITRDEAVLREEVFLRNFGQRFEHVSQLADPEAPEPILLSQCRVRHTMTSASGASSAEPLDRLARFELRGGPFGLTKRYMTLDAVFLARRDRLEADGYDADPIDAPTLTSHLNRVARRIKDKGVFHFVMIASPTGFSADAVSVVTDANHAMAFRDKRALVVLNDLEAGRVIYDESDDRAADFLPLIDHARYESELQRCVAAIRSVLAGERSVSLEAAGQACAATPGLVRSAFDALGAEAGFKVDQIESVGTVLYRTDD